MGKGLLVYFSQGGTTARVAENIAAGLRTAGYQIDLCNMKDKQPPDVRDYDVFGIGLPVYYYRPPFKVMDYLNSLADLGGLPSFVFVLHGTYRFDTSSTIRRALASKGAREVGYYHCRGAEFWVGYLNEGYVFSSGHPTENELAGAEEFGLAVAGHLAGKPYVRPKDDRPPSIIYRFERFLTNRWLARQVYSRLFRVDGKRCNACGLCLELCPAGNITEGKGKRPIWGRNCLLCLYCELKCPKEAITSPTSWPLFRPFMIYNVRRASKDLLLDYARVDPRLPLYSRGEHLRDTEPAGKSVPLGAPRERV